MLHKNPMAYHPDQVTVTVITTLITAAFVGILLYSAFEKVKHKREIYFPRFRTHLKGRTPSPPPPGLMSWISHIDDVNENETLRCVGLDAYIFLSFICFVAKLALVTGLMGMIILWPVYYTSNGHQEGVAGVNLYSMANVHPNGYRLLASVICTYTFTLLFLVGIEKQYEKFVELRTSFLLSIETDADMQQRYTVMVENLPGDYRSAPKLKELFETVFPGSISCAYVASTLQELDTLVEARTETLLQLELAVAYYKSKNMQERKTLKVNKKNEPSFFGDAVDAIDYYTQKLSEIQNSIGRLREISVANSNVNSLAVNPLLPHQAYNNDEAGHVSLVEKDPNSLRLSDKVAPSEEDEDISTMPPGTPCNTGFVTFNSRAAYLSSYRIGVLFDSYPEVHVSPAGEVSEIIWTNLPFSTKEMARGKTVYYTVFRAGILLWGVILAFIAAISNLSNLEKYLPFIKSLDPVTYSLLGGLLPIALMGIFIGLLPTFFAYGATAVGRVKTLSGVQDEVFHWLYSYMLTNVFVTLLAGSVFDSLVDLIDNPLSIVSLLGVSLPGVAIFFANYTISAAIIGGSVELLQIGPLVIYTVYTKVFEERSLTKRQLISGPLADRTMNYGEYIPAVLFIFLILQVYWVMSPLVTVYGAIYFISKYYILKFQFLYMYVPKFEMGGVFFFGIFHYSMLGMLVSSVTMVAYTGLKEGQAATPLMFPLPFIVIYYWMKLKGKYEHRAKDVPFNCAVREDDSRRQQDAILSFKDAHYQQPSLSTPVRVDPQPYRLGATPLIDSQGNVTDEYHGPIVEREARDDKA